MSSLPQPNNANPFAPVSPTFSRSPSFANGGSFSSGPGSGSITSNNNLSNAVARAPQIFKRLLKFTQMDFEVAVWEMTHLMIAPKKVFRNVYYRVRKDE